MLQLRRWTRCWAADHGSQGVQAAGAALAVALIVAALLGPARVTGAPSVLRALTCAASVLSGGAACGGGALGVGEAPLSAGHAPAAATAGGGWGRTATSVTLDLIPVVGEIKGLIEVFTGTDLVTGDALGWWRLGAWRGWSVSTRSSFCATATTWRRGGGDALPLERT